MTTREHRFLRLTYVPHSLPTDSCGLKAQAIIRQFSERLLIGSAIESIEVSSLYTAEKRQKQNIHSTLRKINENRLAYP
jgi:hypothetical protein